jgi:8-oxo-dGTP pyrophosphatase MutT (NUDIX family)
MDANQPTYFSLTPIILAKIKQQLLRHLPGFEAHYRMMPSTRRIQLEHLKQPKNARCSAVLILLYKEEDVLQTVFIRRPEYDGVHGGQISFPGGKCEDSDRDLIHTALRETFEEIGCDIDEVAVLGLLSPLYIPPSHYLVHPVVAYVDAKPHFVADPSEVAEIVTIPMHELLNEKCIATRLFGSKGVIKIEAPCFEVGDIRIWGATAMILNEWLMVFSEAIKK